MAENSLKSIEKELQMELETRRKEEIWQDLLFNYQRGKLIIPTIKNNSWRSNSTEIEEINEEEIEEAAISEENKRNIETVAKRTKTGQTSYPTNNFLGISKCIHMAILRSEMGEEAFQNDPLLTELQQKSWLGRVDFVKLYSTERLYPFLDRMFKSHRLYRELHRSRTKPKTKKICFAKIYLFAKAYASKVFNRIN